MGAKSLVGNHLQSPTSTVPIFEARGQPAAPDRVHVTNSRAIARDGLPGVSYVEKTETEKLIAQAARRAVEKELMPAADRAKVLDEGLR